MADVTARNGAEPGTLDDADTQQSIETLQRLAR